MGRRKHYSEINVCDLSVKVSRPYDLDVVVELDCGDGEHHGAFEWFRADAEGYMTYPEFSKAMAFALGLIEAKRALERANE